MSYIIRKTDGSTLTVLQEGLVLTPENATISSLNLIGKNVSGFGQYQNDNFVWLLEHFADFYEPYNPTTGQIWFNTDPIVNRPLLNDGTSWRPLGVTLYSTTSSAEVIVKHDNTISSYPLSASQPGDFWWKSDDRQLYIKTTSTGYQLIGPERAVGFLDTKMRSTVIADSTGTNHPVIETLINGEVVSITSQKTFATTATISAIGFPTVYRGITFKNYDPTHRFESTSTDVTLAGIDRFLDEGYPRKDQNETVASQWTFQNGAIIGTSSAMTEAAGNLSIASGGANMSLFVNGATGVVGVFQEGLIPANNLRQNLGNSNYIWNNAFIQNISAGSASTTGLLTGAWAITGGSKFLPVADLSNDLGSATQRFNNVFTSNLNPGGTAGTISGDWKFGNGGSLVPYLDLNNTLGGPGNRFSSIHVQTVNAGAGLPANLIGEFQLQGDLVPTIDNTYRLGGPGQAWEKVETVDIHAVTATIDGLTATINTLADINGSSITTFDKDGTLTANSDTNVSTQQAVKTYVDNTKAYLIGLIEALQKQLTDGLAGIRSVPAGTIMHHAGSTPPDGYLVADGRELFTTSYPDLFASIGYTYGGAGNKFNIPNLLGEFIRGWDAGRGVDSGRNLGSFQGADVSSHQHYFNDVWLIQSDGGNPMTGNRNLDGSYGYPARNVDGQPEPEAGYGAYVNPVNDTSYNDGGVNDNAIWTIRNKTEVAGGSEVRPRNVALLPIIKFRNGS